jgi:hypothetical protein
VNQSGTTDNQAFLLLSEINLPIAGTSEEEPTPGGASPNLRKDASGYRPVSVIAQEASK